MAGPALILFGPGWPSEILHKARPAQPKKNKGRAGPKISTLEPSRPKKFWAETARLF